jgi:hypothetical protein
LADRSDYQRTVRSMNKTQFTLCFIGYEFILINGMYHQRYGNNLPESYFKLKEINIEIGRKDIAKGSFLQKRLIFN